MYYLLFLKKQHNAFIKGLLGFIIISFAALPAFAAFNSGSDGSDSALNITTPGTTLFDPAALGIDDDGDNVFHFTTITIAVGCTLQLSSENMGTRPVAWLASGDVTISGVLNLDGALGHAYNGAHIPSRAGAGGYNGGVGIQPGVVNMTPGEGPGGGGVGGGGGTVSCNYGAGAGYKTPGYANTPGGCNAVAGKAYGNKYLLPLVGGSGGGGGGHFSGGSGAGGGAGGGAILIASSGTVQLNGRITAKGGTAGANLGYGEAGSGSGGAIRVVANTITGSGYIYVNGGGNTMWGSQGYIRLEAYSCTLPFGNIQPNGTIGTPGLPLFPSQGSLPTVKIVSIDGITVPADPKGTYTLPDVTINKSDSCDLVIQAKNIPVGTMVNLTLNSENEGSFSFNATALTGTQDSSSVTARTRIPPGFSRFELRATW